MPIPPGGPSCATPNFPDYPSAHACHTTALSPSAAAFFDTNKLAFTLDSRVTSSTRTYERLQDVIKDVNEHGY